MLTRKPVVGESRSMKKKVNLCRYQDCSDRSYTRGLCMRHYLVAIRFVKQGKITWRELEKAGKAVPPKVQTKEGGSWFLEKK